MIKRRSIVAILLALCMLFANGCTLPWKTERRADIADSFTYRQEFENNRQYASLSKELKECYGTIYTVLTESFDKDATVRISDKDGKTITSIGVRIALPHSLSGMKDSRKLFTAISYDNPHFFYLGNTYGLEGTEQDDTTQYDTILLTYTMDAEERQAARIELESAVDRIVSNKPQTTDDYLVEHYLHDELISSCSYDKQASTKAFDDDPNAYSAYGALVEGEAVCEGYARAMQLLLKRCDIPATLVFGESVEDGEQHMWNIVTINGNDYHLDPTWNDSNDLARHNYFNTTTEQIAISHRIADNQAGITDCTATKDNYYVREGLYIDSYSRQDIAKAIATRIQRGDTSIELFFHKDRFSSALLFLKNSTATKEMVDPYLASVGKSLWKYTLYGESEEHILCLRKE